MVGLLLSGVVIGPHGFGVFGEQRPIADFMAQLGQLLLMFFAGLEIDLTRFRQAQGRSMLFGLITAGVPLLLGTTVGLMFGYRIIPAIVVGSLIASHALLAVRLWLNLGSIDSSPSLSLSVERFCPTRSLWSCSQSVFRHTRTAFHRPDSQHNLSR